MQNVRTFLLTTEQNPEGVEYSYDAADGLLQGVAIKSKMTAEQIQRVIENTKFHVELFLSWASGLKRCEVIELQTKITFDLFWQKYNDKVRSSKKRSQRLWEKLGEADQVKAFYFIQTYNRNRGSAEKKYCETYLGAELWNN